MGLRVERNSLLHSFNELKFRYTKRVDRIHTVKSSKLTNDTNKD